MIKFTAGEGTGSDAARRNPIRLAYKVAGYVFAWLLALFITDPEAKLWALVWMFPLGLIAVISRHAANNGGWSALFACVAVYLVHGYFFFRSGNWKWTALLYGVLVLLLSGNIAGCRQMINTH